MAAKQWIWVIYGPHLPALREVYRKEVKQPCDYLLLANASQAYGDSHHLFKQIGTAVEDYQWVDDNVFNTLLKNLESKIPRVAEFETVDVYNFPEPIRKGCIFYNALGAKKDAVADLATPTVYEFKFCSTGISNGHKLQLMIGAAVVALEKTYPHVHCVLVNYRSGETAEATLTHEQCKRFIENLQVAFQEV